MRYRSRGLGKSDRRGSPASLQGGPISWHELELVEASGQEHEEEIELALDVSDSDADLIAREMQRLIAETFVVERARRLDAGDLRIGIRPRAHPREAVRALMARLGSRSLVEDDGCTRT
jgi:hypothetical protein